MGLVEGGGEGLAETEGEDELAVGEVRGDLADASLARGGAGVDVGGCERGGAGAEAGNGGVQDREGILIAKEARVRV